MMMARKEYSHFERIPGAPDPVTAVVSRRVKFHELDPMTVVWHGRYPEYFEEAQIALDKKCGFSYPFLRDAGIVTPIHQFHIEYKQSLYDDELFQVKATMVWTEAARINMEYVITKEDGTIASTGYTVQLFVDAHTKEVLWFPPPFWEDCLKRWKNGEFAV
ncbi:MAG: acyl-CoA thioesterase [Lentisphaeria bacterium]|nr:acyl-CoA thioesterase [Lentisphaeria bacterium]